MSNDPKDRILIEEDEAEDAYGDFIEALKAKNDEKERETTERLAPDAQ